MNVTLMKAPPKSPVYSTASHQSGPSASEVVFNLSRQIWAGRVEQTVAKDFSFQEQNGHKVDCMQKE